MCAGYLDFVPLLKISRSRRFLIAPSLLRRNVCEEFRVGQRVIDLVVEFEDLVAQGIDLVVELQEFDHVQDVFVYSAFILTLLVVVLINIQQHPNPLLLCCCIFFTTLTSLLALRFLLSDLGRRLCRLLFNGWRCRPLHVQPQAREEAHEAVLGDLVDVVLDFQRLKQCLDQRTLMVPYLIHLRASLRYTLHLFVDLSDQRAELFVAVLV